ncbi:hypothetical protein BJ138DRAFT_1150946 [Hygrophoropsis aurantiaca]|uniref:Uncharacterized protein n=1 Tax=Hygrophoropsis aurantiaca TaxID=72124 RepID=A0ACB8ADN2_9AGAM|nr:hypothetical protein BJ138DRAFT_1150946 [Hygrophoropsis aurantiaca]
MNNLLRTLTESQVKSSPDLKLLLATVKDARSRTYDAKLSDPFYESLEGLITDLRTVTMDNHDAEAFLKPVSKSEVPDYLDVIMNPMDLQTMLKKVKSKQYKSKREFKDDLDLIWSNCYTYNAAEDHPLRLCAKRLEKKANRLLMSITDRKERVDPPIPVDMISRASSRPKLNGFSSHERTKYRSPTLSAKTTSPSSQPARSSQSKKPRRDLSFADMPAILRTPDGMAAFQQLDMEAESSTRAATSNGFVRSSSSVAERLKSYTMSEEYESGSEDDRSIASVTVESDSGEKRKLNGIASHRPRKRVRLTPPDSDDDEVNDLWWNAMQSDALLGNGLPSLPHFSPPSPSPHAQSGSSRHLVKKRKRRKKASAASNTMLSVMNSNIKTLKRVRRTHAKFAALNMNSEEGVAVDEPPDLGEEDIEETIDERPWRPQGTGIEIGEAHASDCLRWMDGKILEHVGFQGSSSIALDVLTGVASEFLLNVGRTLRFLCDKYSNSMTPEEIILHTLFESGTTKIQDLERYIQDDVIRYGARLGDLEKKLEGAYREVTAVEALDDDALFAAEDDEEDEGAFVMGNFSDAFGDDFLGLRELGIAAEFGMSSLTIPKKLLKGKNKAGPNQSSQAKPKEPPLPYPPPPPFVPISSKNVEDQIGLLKPFFQERIAVLSGPPPFATGLPPLNPYGFGQPPVPSPADRPVVTLPEDSPNPAQVKVGPLGQVIKTGVWANAAKKKIKVKETTPQANLIPGSAIPMEPLIAFDENSFADSPKKKKAPSVSPKKKPKAVDLPPVITASA